MIVDLRTIAHSPRHFIFTLKPIWWKGDEESDQIIGLDGCLDVHISISRTGTKYMLEGRLSGGLLIRCDRCLEVFHRNLESEFWLFLAHRLPEKDGIEIELMEDDMSIDFVVGDEVDLNDIVREQAYLSLPIKSLCREECLGLCPVCGANLNKEKCECQRVKGHLGFSKLKNLKFKGE